MPDLSVTLGPLRLENPVVAGSCELTMTEAGIRACVDAGAAAVVAKSVNEQPAAARQLDLADYALVGADRSVVPWEEGREGDSLLCRSGLGQVPLDEWVALLDRCQRYASRRGSLVIGSVTVADPEPAARIAARLAEAVPAVELNVGAPHGREAGAVRLLDTPAAVGAWTAAARSAVACPLVVKLSGQGGDVVAQARAAAAAGADAVAMIGRFPGFVPDLDTWEPVLGSWGAIGGAWSLPVACYWVSKTHRALPELPIAGTGGARGGADVLRFLLSGARAVELASAPLVRGPAALTDAVADVATYLERKRLPSLTPLVGAAARRARTYEEIPPLDPPAWRRWAPGP